MAVTVVNNHQQTNTGISNQVASTQNEPILRATNPCVRNCCLDEKKVCLGCGRRLPEILEWHHADNNRLEEIITAAKERLLERAKFSNNTD